MDDGFATGFLAGQDSGGNGGLGGFGDGWLGLILFAMIFGWGRGGFGGGFGGGGNDCGCGCATQADVRNAVDQQTLISKLDQQTYGLADTFTALNGTLNSNFRGIDNAICNLGFQTQTGFNALGSQLASCCCDIERGIDGVNYNMASHFCNLNNTLNSNTRDIIDNQNCNTRQIMDFLVQSKIDKLQSENADLRLRASQAAQNQYLVDQLRPCPVPAYITCNPFAASYGYGSGYGNSGCGCGCG